MFNTGYLKTYLNANTNPSFYLYEYLHTCILFTLICLIFSFIMYNTRILTKTTFKTSQRYQTFISIIVKKIVANQDNPQS